MFRGKESSNRIKLSRLAQDSLGLWRVGGGGGWVYGVGVVVRCPPHMCTCMHAHAHACVVNMIISCKWPPPLGESLGIPYDVIHACRCMNVHAHAYVHVCAHVWGHPLTTPTQPPPGGTPGISQNSIALELIEIFQFSLKI